MPAVVNTAPDFTTVLKKSAGKSFRSLNGLAAAPSQLISRRPVGCSPAVPPFDGPSAFLNSSTFAATSPVAMKTVAWGAGFDSLAAPQAIVTAATAVPIHPSLRIDVPFHPVRLTALDCAAYTKDEAGGAIIPVGSRQRSRNRIFLVFWGRVIRMHAAPFSGHKRSVAMRRSLALLSGSLFSVCILFAAAPEPRGEGERDPVARARRPRIGESSTTSDENGRVNQQGSGGSAWESTLN